MANNSNYFRGLISTLILCWTASAMQAQHQDLLKGTEAYQAGDYDGAAIRFEKAISENDNSVSGKYNLANSYYRTKKYDEAISRYQEVISQSDDDLIQSKAYYNLGNSYLAQAQAGSQGGQMGEKEQEQLKNAIDSYKDALRKNNEDYDAKNNLGVAYKMMQQLQQQQQEQQQKQDQEKKDDDQKDEQEKEEQENQDDKQDEKKDDKQDEGEQSEPDPNQPEEEDPIKKQNDLEKGKPQDLEKDEVERLLERIEEEDKKVQEKLMKKRRNDGSKIEKDW